MPEVPEGCRVIEEGRRCTVVSGVPLAVFNHVFVFEDGRDQGAGRNAVAGDFEQAAIFRAADKDHAIVRDRQAGGLLHDVSMLGGIDRLQDFYCLDGDANRYRQQQHQ